jgi:iron complex outermembrane receptor protein
MTDFRIGGYIFNEPYQYTMTLGVNPDTENREGEGFYDYTYANGVTKKTGIILDGVVSDGAGGWKKNEKVIAYEDYIQTTYDWGNGGHPNRTLFLAKNTWWKVREVALSYSLPKDLIRNSVIKNLTLSVYGRNLFYLYKSIPNYDPETSNSTNWKDQLTIGGSASPVRTVGCSLRATF